MTLLSPAPRGTETQLEGILQRAAIEVGDKAADHLDVISFLARRESYTHQPAMVEIVESHMSLVFLAGDLVFKLKRPIHLKFVDFRALAARKMYCERELAVNQQLAPGIYLRMACLVRMADGNLALDGEGEPVDYLVVMRRLDHDQSLEARVRRGDVTPADIGALADVLARFYRGQPPVDISASQMIERWQCGAGQLETALTNPQFGLPPELTGPPLSAIRQFLAKDAALLTDRVERGWVRDGHGDLKPEHVYLGPPILLVDRLEIDEQRRWCDPFDEMAFLAMECTKLGAPWIGPMLIGNLAEALGDRPSPALLRFYGCYRACLRARFSIEHLLDEAPRTPERWPRRAREYLQLASAQLAGDAPQGRSQS